MNINELHEKSVQVILKNQSSSGGYIASPNFRVYAYSWFRDGAFIADAMTNSGHHESALKFHEWASSIILKRENKINDLVRRGLNNEIIAGDEHLHCRYTLDGEKSKEGWTNFQLDGFGTWLWSMGRYRSNGFSLPKACYEATSLLIPYLEVFWETPSFDWWEENDRHQHVSTLGSIAAGLSACALWEELSEADRRTAASIHEKIALFITQRGTSNGRLIKWIGGEEIDASLLSLISPMELFNPQSEIGLATSTHIADTLGVLGTHRHLLDGYFGGAPWPLLSAFLGLVLIKQGKTDEARGILNWIASTADGEGNLPEQVNENLLFPEIRNEWLERWGVPAQPLLWSHAMFLLLESELKRASKEITND